MLLKPRLVIIVAVMTLVIAGVVRADPPAASAASPLDFRATVRAARAKVFPAVVYLKCLRQSMESGRARTEDVGGSGVVISEDGELLTNWHVVDRAVEIRALLSDGRAFKADLVASDRDLDIALVRLRIESKHEPIPVAEIGNSGVLQEGDFVMAMGAPWGLNRSVSVGIIACTRRYLPESSEYSLWLQTDASISPGNSGGPLVDTDGRVIGINTLGRSSGGDMGFAIPSDTIREVLPRMRERKQVGWSWSGILLQPLRDFNRDTYFDGTTGVIVAGVEPGSPAETAGLKSRDRLLSVGGAVTNGVTSEDLPNIRRRIALLPADEPVELLIERGDQAMKIALTPRDKGRVQGEELDCPRWGVTMKQINRFENAELHRVRPEGVFVFGVRTPGNAMAAGLADNDIVIEVDGRPIATLADLHRAYDASIASIGTKKRLLVKLIRAGQLRQLVLDISRDYERE
ncbi:MAG: trypsin-like peptidase domain-containing protein [Phycisphaerae bacterium]|nr:trypsin-like peptidase domain-containing protein [Phycisphaerae bacterium]